MWRVMVPFLLVSSTAETRQDAQARQGFFDRKAVDFWGDGGSPRTSLLQPAPTPTESIWAEPIRLPDGRYATYVPPRAVLEFLENPSRENARKYLDWQAARMERIRKAAALLSELAREKTSNVPKGDAATEVPVTLTYFRKPG